MVFHDDTLDRLTEAHGALSTLTSSELKTVAFQATADRMMTLGELCDLVAGRVPLILEVKSHFDGDTRLADRVAEIVQGYAGPVAAMSFDPVTVASVAPLLRRDCRAAWWRRMPARSMPGTPTSLRYATAAFRARPHFLAWSVRDLPASGRCWAAGRFGLPLLTWTVRTEAERIRARRWANQMIFEGFRP